MTALARICQDCHQHFCIGCVEEMTHGDLHLCPLCANWSLVLHHAAGDGYDEDLDALAEPLSEWRKAWVRSGEQAPA